MLDSEWSADVFWKCDVGGTVNGPAPRHLGTSGVWGRDEEWTYAAGAAGAAAAVTIAGAGGASAVRNRSR